MDPVEEFAGRHRNSLQECIVGLVVARGEKFFEQFVVEFPQNLSADKVKVKDSFIEIGMEFMALLRSHDGGNLSPDVINLPRPIREVYREFTVIENEGKYFMDGGPTLQEGQWTNLSRCTRYPADWMGTETLPHPSIYEISPKARKARIRVKESIEAPRQ